jgi:hypothetical protein
MKERVVFQTNVPVTAALAYADGIKGEGRYGDQVMYSLCDERVMYVPPVVRDKLVELGIKQKESFSICKDERRDGNRRFIEWVVKRLESEQAGVQSPEPTGSHSPSVASAPGAVTGGVVGSNGNCSASPIGNASSGNGNGDRSTNGKGPGPSNGSHAGLASLRAALAASIDAAIEAERYATEHGLSVRFGSEDLRAMALSLFIQHARDGGVR